MIRRPPRSTLFPYTTLFRSRPGEELRPFGLVFELAGDLQVEFVTLLAERVGECRAGHPLQEFSVLREDLSHCPGRRTESPNQLLPGVGFRSRLGDLRLSPGNGHTQGRGRARYRPVRLCSGCQIR